MMVRVGDKIDSNKGDGVVIGFSKTLDGRYRILFKDGNKIKSLIEGDDDFELL